MIYKVPKSAYVMKYKHGDVQRTFRKEKKTSLFGQITLDVKYMRFKTILR